MSDFSVLITPPGPGSAGSEPLEFATPDMATSLVVADLNLEQVRAFIAANLPS